MDLQRELGRPDDEIVTARRSLRRAEQREGLVANLQRLGWQIEALDELPPRRLIVAAERIGIRPPLELAVVDGDCLDAAAHLRGGLLEVAANAGGKSLVLPVGGEIAGDLVNARIAAHRLRRGQKMIDALSQRDGPGIDAVPRGPCVGDRRQIAEHHSLAGGQIAGRGDFEGPECRRTNRCLADVAAGGEAPPVPGEDPHADRAVNRRIERLHFAVADPDVIVVRLGKTDVGVAKGGRAERCENLFELRALRFHGQAIIGSWRSGRAVKANQTKVFELTPGCAAAAVIRRKDQITSSRD